MDINFKDKHINRGVDWENLLYVTWNSINNCTNTFLLQIVENGENQQMQGVLLKHTQKLHFCVRPWLLLTILNFSGQGPTVF